jgi:hypothetical protein
MLWLADVPKVNLRVKVRFCVGVLQPTASLEDRVQQGPNKLHS